MRFNSEELLLILELVGARQVVAPTPEFPYRVTIPGTGYSPEPRVSQLQAKLSIMLEAASS